MYEIKAALAPMRVQVPAYTDAWMRGDRYGDRVGVSLDGSHYRVKLDKSGHVQWFSAADCSIID